MNIKFLYEQFSGFISINVKKFISQPTIKSPFSVIQKGYAIKRKCTCQFIEKCQITQYKLRR